MLKSSNPSDSRRIVIGIISIPKGTEFTNRCEYAAWYTKGVTTEEQTVTVTTNGYWVFYSYEGEATASDYSAHFAGNRIGSNVDSEVGKRVIHSVQIYDYSFAEAYARDECGYRAKLDPSVGIRVSGISSRNGVERAMYSLCSREDVIPSQVRVEVGELVPLA